MDTEETQRWATRYQAALARNLKQPPGSSLRPALGLGRLAVKLGMETLDVARAHEVALGVLAPPSVSSMFRRRLLERAKHFLSETIVPIEKTHQAALTTNVRVKELTETLFQRTAQSRASSERLKRGIASRRSAEHALRQSGKRGKRLLKASSQRQIQLRQKAHFLLSAQEKERQVTSNRLRNDIAQSLLSIQLRLMTTKLAVIATTKALTKEIAGTQKLVRESVRAIRQGRS